MVYLGSKSKYAKYIVPILQKAIDTNNVTEYYEPFVGGANIIDKIKCEHRYGYDRSETLIALLTAARDNFDAIPEDGNREMWDEGKAYVKDGASLTTMTLTEVGAIEFLASFGTRGFPGGYARNTPTRNYYKQRRNGLLKQSPKLKDIIFGVQDYQEFDLNIKNAVIYCDPPYAGTKKYNYANQPDMNYNEFWDWVRKLSQNNYVYVSEQQAPDDFEIIWEQEAKRTVGRDNNFKAVERLYKYCEKSS